MPRVSRIVASSGIYHVMLRGNEQRDIFIDDEDRTRFIGTLKDKLKEGHFKLYAYCLMDNHIHMLISESDKKISNFIRRITVSYAYYFNKKYKRIGHLFQDRFKSEPIETDAYLLAAVRYAHKNPVKAGIVMNEADYRWSSYNYYIGNKDFPHLVEKDVVLGIFSEDSKKAQDLFVQYSQEDIADVLMDVVEIESDNEKTIKGENEASKYIEDFLKKRDMKLENLRLRVFRDVREELIDELKQNSDLSVRQIADLLMVNRGMVQRVKT